MTGVSHGGQTALCCRARLVADECDSLLCSLLLRKELCGNRCLGQHRSSAFTPTTAGIQACVLLCVCACAYVCARLSRHLWSVCAMSATGGVGYLKVADASEV